MRSRARAHANWASARGRVSRSRSRPESTSPSRCTRACAPGATAVPVDLRDPRASVHAEIVIDAPLACRAAPLTAAGHDLDATALIVSTSGTSGAPREVPLTYGNVLWSALGSAVALGLDPAERWLCTLPLVHVGGLSIIVRSAIYGTTAVIHERFESDAAVDALMGRAITIVSVVATTLTRLLDGGLERPPALRCALAGGGPVPATLVARAREAGVAVSQTYGLTEASSQVATQTPGDTREAAARRSSARPSRSVPTARSSSAGRP